MNALDVETRWLTRSRWGQKVAYGTFGGVYFQDLREPNRESVKVLALTDVAQVDVLNDYVLLIVSSRTDQFLISISHRRLTTGKRLRYRWTHWKRWIR